jgi:hypothetical protein
VTLAEDRSALGRQNDQRVLEVLVAAGDLGLQSGQVAAASGLAARTCRAAVDRLLGRLLATREGQRGRLRATMAGRSEAGAGAPGVDLMPQLEEAIDCFPTQAHRAFLRLLLSGIVARHHLAGFYHDGWGGFIALGPTNTGKTSMAKLPCGVFGWPPVGTVRMLPDETAGSVFARRVQGADGWSVVIPPVLGEAYVCFDEWDKADPDVRKQAGQLLMGYVATELEGQRIEIRPTVMVCLNTGPEGLRVMPQAYVRRAVVLDTGPLEGMLGDIDQAMRKLFRSHIPRLQLALLRPPADELADADRAALRTGLRAGLTADGWRLCDVEVLSRLTLGRAALTGDQDLRRAALATAVDYLATAATVGHTRPGWAAPLMAQLGGRGPLAPDAGAAEEELDRRHRAQAQKESRERQQMLEFAADREQRAQLLLNAKAALGRVRDPEARGVAAALARATKNVRGARSRVSLDEAWSQATTWLDQATRIRRAREEAKASVVQRRRAEQQSRQAQRAASRAEKRQQAEHRRQERPKWVIWRKRLAALIPVESSVELMDRLKDLRLVEWIPPAASPAGANLWGKVRHTLTTTGHYVHVHTGRQVDSSEAANIWLQEWAGADRQVVALGGKPATPPRYREKQVRTPRSLAYPAARRSVGHGARPAGRR